MNIAQNLKNIEADIQKYKIKNKIQLIAATKYVDARVLSKLIAAGITTFGENKVQSLLAKRELIKNEAIDWHFIGHLQTNKIKKIIPFISYIHSVDSLNLARAIDLCAKKQKRKIKILLEINVSGEESKYGFTIQEIKACFDQFINFDSLVIMGLMTMAPLGADASITRNIFRQLAQLLDFLKNSNPWCENLVELSMGMSGDYQIALEEGATMIRIGSKLFQ